MTSHCLGNGTWSLTEENNPCYAIDCSVFPNADNLTEVVSANYSTSYGSLVNYTCSTGYSLNGSFLATATCGFHNHWLLPVNCTPVNCGVPKYLQNATITEIQLSTASGCNKQTGQHCVTDTFYSDTFTYQCNQGLWFSPGVIKFNTTCQANASWTVPPSCVDVDCGAPPSIPLANITVPPNRGHLYQSTLNYTCHIGYSTNKQTTVFSSECLIDGKWSVLPGDQPCQDVHCNLTLAPPNTLVSVLNTTLLSTDTQLDCTDHNYWFTDQNRSKSLTCVLNSDLSSASYSDFPLQGCSLVDCDVPTSLVNGSVEHNSTTVNNTATHRCDAGHHFSDWSNSHTAYCTHSGTWTTFNHTCVLTDCLDPPDLAYGDWKLDRVNDSLEGSTATYWCKPGYDVSNNLTNIKSVCQQNQTWSVVMVTCIPRDCGPPTNDMAHANVSFNSTLVYSWATYTCYEGYTTQSNKPYIRVRCEATALWSNQGDYCQPIQCGDPPSLSNAVWSSNSTGYTGVTQYTCRPGYQFSHKLTTLNITSECTHTQSWTPLSATCQPKDCGDPPEFNDTRRYFTNTTYLHTAVYQPHEGFSFIGSLTSNITVPCAEDGNWKLPATMETKFVQCGVPQYVVNTVVNYTSTSYGATTTYVCESNTHFTDLHTNHTLMCSANAQWTPPVTSYCTSNLSAPVALPPNTGYLGGPIGMVSTIYFREIRTAKGPEASNNSATTSPLVELNISTSIDAMSKRCDSYVPKNAIALEGTPILYGYQAFRCLEGYEFEDGTITRSYICLPDVDQQKASWHFPHGFMQGHCHLKRCVELPVYPDTWCDTRQNTVGTQVHCGCEKTGLSFNNGAPNVTFQCMADKRWSHDYGACLKRCPALSLIEHSDVTSGYDTSLGSTLKMSCHRGYRFPDGTQTRDVFCSPDAVWLNVERCYVNVCPVLVAPTNGSINSSLAVYDSYVEVKCSPGYTFTRGNYSTVLYCLDGAQWNASYTDCIDVVCDSLPEAANAVKFGNGTSYNSEVLYECIGGRIQLPSGVDSYRTNEGHNQTTSVCEQTGQWSDQHVSCELGRCHPVPTVTYAVADSTNASKGSVVTYRCLPGYWFTESEKTQVVVCDNLQWNISHYQCVEVTCPAVPTIGHATANDTSTSYLSYIGFDCDLGYSFVDNNVNASGTVVCSDSGDWQVVSPEGITQVPTTCSLIHCGPQPTVLNAVAPSTGVDTYGTTITYRCKNGYWFTRAVLSQAISCSANATWYPTLPTQCNAIHCPSLPYWEGLILNTTSTEIMTMVNASCGPNSNGKEQMFSDGSATKLSLCSQQGDWIPAIPSCIDKVIPPKFNPPATEAPGARSVGALGIAMITVIVLAAFLADLPTLILATHQLITNISSIWVDMRAAKTPVVPPNTGSVEQPVNAAAVEGVGLNPAQDSTVSGLYEPRPPDPINSPVPSISGSLSSHFSLQSDSLGDLEVDSNNTREMTL